VFELGGTVCDLLLEPSARGLHCQNAQPHPTETGRCHDEGNQHREPDSLGEERQNHEADTRTDLAPHPLVIARGHAKPVLARRDERIVRNSPASSVDPVRVVVLEQVSKPNPLRGDERQRGVVDLQVADTGGQNHRPTQVVSDAVNDDPLDEHGGRRSRREIGVSLDHRDSLNGRYPQSAVVVEVSGGLPTPVALRGREAVRSPVHDRVDASEFTVCHRRQLAARHLGHAHVAGHPEETVPILQYPRNRRVGQALIDPEQVCAIVDQAY